MELPDKCACCGSNLDRFLQPIILSIVRQQPATGYAIVKQIAEYSTFKGHGPDPTGVYRYLKIMMAKGMLAKQPGEESERELYAITPEGEQCLARWLDTLAEYSGQITRLMVELKDA